MFGMSVTEIVIILVLALVLLGPDELPKVAKTLGKGLRELRKASDDLKSTFEQEMVKLDDDHVGGPMLVPPTHEGAPTAGALDQLRDPAAARAAARTLAATNDPSAARAAARMAASGQVPAPEGALAGVAAAAAATAGDASSEATAPAAPAQAMAEIVPAASGQPPALSTVAAPTSTPLSDASAGASATASANALADAAREPTARPAPAATIPRQKKSEPAA